MSAALGCNNSLSFSFSRLHAFLTHLVETFAGVQYSTFRPELAVRVGRRQRLRAALQGIRDEGGDEHRGGFSLVV